MAENICVMSQFLMIQKCNHHKLRVRVDISQFPGLILFKYKIENSKTEAMHFPDFPRPGRALLIWKTLKLTKIALCLSTSSSSRANLIYCGTAPFPWNTH
jgi:hypothetical protein